MSEWGRFLAELDHRIAKAERDDPARAERLKAMRPRLRTVDPAEGERRLDQVAPAFFDQLNEGTGFDTPETR